MRCSGPLSSIGRGRERLRAVVRSHASLCAVVGRCAPLRAVVRGYTPLCVVMRRCALQGPSRCVVRRRARGRAPLRDAVDRCAPLSAVVRGYTPLCVARRRFALLWAVGLRCAPSCVATRPGV